MTALIHAQSALSELRSSDAYRAFKANGTLSRTHIGACEREILVAISELQPAPPPVVAYPEPPRGTLIDRTTPVYYDAFSSPSAEVGREITGFRVHDTPFEGIGFLWWKTGSVPPVRDSTSRYSVHDCVAENVGSGGTRNGTTEFCFRLGQSADVDRIVARNPGWCPIWVGGRSVNSVIRNADIEALGTTPDGGLHGQVGVYIEHAAVGTRIERSRIHSTGIGVNMEWWYTENDYVSFMPPVTQQKYPGRAGPYGLVVSDCIIHSERGRGINVGPGCFGVHVERVKFIGCPLGAFVHPARNLADPSQPCTIDMASCDFSECTGPHEVLEDLAVG